MNVDPPNPDSPDEILLRQARDAANAAPSLPRGQTTGTFTHTPTRMPKRIGRYHIKSVIASGGMGTVYEAVQEKPHRTVALKLMRHGIASRSALRRFEYESQILARLRHPGIAHVYEAGTHRDDSGTVPYFAMEYIVGAKPITKYVAEKKRGTRERMALFANVCEAIHHGHQKGIIHRDLKPSNILVDAEQQVKIIDFGVARSTDSDLAVTTLQTDIGQLIGTLQYMSPEQCEADPHNIDTRSDVYALGVVFYELLCDRLPYNVTRVAMHEATRIIREEKPTKLSTLNKTLRGDVETIALKALEKDRERRYQSATDFAQDIRRYLNNEAITARPPSATYKLRKFIRRNRTGVMAASVMATALIVSAVVSAAFALRAAAERELYLDQLVVNAVLEAISGNLDAAEAVIKQADRLGTDNGRISMLQGQVALQRGQPIEAIEHLEQATKLLADDVAAQGMLAQAWDAQGTWIPYFRELNKLDAMTPVTFHDYLAKGAAESKMVPGQGIDLLDEAVRIRPGSGVARLIRAQAGWRQALHTLDREDVERALDDAHFAKELLPGNPGALVAHLYVQLTASFYYKANGQLSESEAAFEMARTDAEALKKFVDRPHAYRARMRFFQAAGRPHEALEEARRGLQNTKDNTYLHMGYGFQLAQLGKYEEAYQHMPSLYTFFGMFFVADLPDGRSRVRDEIDDMLATAPPIHNLFSQVTLRLLGRKDEAVEVSRTLRRQLLSTELPDYLQEWYQPRFAFACDDLTEEEFLETAGAYSDRLCQAHYFIGMNRLAEGDASSAREHLQQSVEATLFGPGLEQVLARIFLAHLERDPDWTPSQSLPNDEAADAPGSQAPDSDRDEDR